MTTPVPVTPTLTITADQAVYNVGDTLTLTAAYSDATTAPVSLTISGTATDAAGNTVSATTTVTVNTAGQQPMTITVSDSFGDAYTQVSNASGTAVFTTVIGNPPA
jgi:hypothetical protein